MADPAPAPAPAPAPVVAAPAPVVDPKPASSVASVPAPVVEPKVDPKAADPKAPEPKVDPATTFDIKAVKLPEGFTLDEKLSSKYSEILNDAKLTPQARGEALLSLYTDAVKQVGETNTKAWTDLNQKWVDEVKADTEIGGDKLQPTQQVIAKAIDTLGPERAKAFREALDMTGAGNNPAIIRGLKAWASALTEGSHVPGSPPAGKGTIQETFFPNSPEMKG